MKTLTGQALADAYAKLLSVELGGPVWAVFEGRRVVVRGEGLPVHPQYPVRLPNGWSLGDRKTPTHCRKYLENRGCMEQWVAYDPDYWKLFPLTGKKEK